MWELELLLFKSGCCKKAIFQLETYLTLTSGCEINLTNVAQNDFPTPQQCFKLGYILMSDLLGPGKGQVCDI